MEDIYESQLGCLFAAELQLAVLGAHATQEQAQQVSLHDLSLL